jgi:hypothetical protein
MCTTRAPLIVEDCLPLMKSGGRSQEVTHHLGQCSESLKGILAVELFERRRVSLLTTKAVK